jgi:hypothetical protein
LGESEPPTFANPFLSLHETVTIDILVFTKRKWPTEMKDAEK